MGPAPLKSRAVPALCALAACLLLACGATAARAPQTAEDLSDPRGAASIDELGTRYTTYFVQGDADKILRLYDLEGVDKKAIEDLKKAHADNFNRTISGIRYEDVSQGHNLFNVKSAGGVVGMATTVSPVIKQMVVSFSSTAVTDAAQQVPLMYTLIGKKDGRYYLVAYRRGGR